MFHSSKKPHKPTLAATNGAAPYGAIPIARTEGGSVSAIRHFVFGGGDKGADGWKFNSLSAHWRRKSADEGFHVPRIKSPSFRTPIRTLFPNWSKSSCSRYTSTPDLNKGSGHDKELEGSLSFSGRPSVKRMVQELEGSSRRFESSLPSKDASKSVHSLKTEVDPSFSRSPDQFLLPQIGERSVPISLKRVVSLSEIKEGRVAFRSVCGQAEAFSPQIPPNSNRDFSSGVCGRLESTDAVDRGGLANDILGRASNIPVSRAHPPSSPDNLAVSGPNWMPDSSHSEKDAEHILSDSFSESIFESLNQKFGSGEIFFSTCDHVVVSSLEGRSSADQEVTFDQCPLTSSEQGIEQDVGETEQKKAEKTVVVQEPGRFLARWVPVEDL